MTAIVIVPVEVPVVVMTSPAIKMSSPVGSTIDTISPVAVSVPDIVTDVDDIVVVSPMTSSRPSVGVTVSGTIIPSRAVAVTRPITNDRSVTRPIAEIRPISRAVTETWAVSFARTIGKLSGSVPNDRSITIPRAVSLTGTVGQLTGPITNVGSVPSTRSISYRREFTIGPVADRRKFATTRSSWSGTCSRQGVFRQVQEIPKIPRRRTACVASSKRGTVSGSGTVSSRGPLPH